MRTPKSSTQKQSRKRREGKSALTEFDGAKPIADERLGRAPFLGPSCHYACGLDSRGCYCGQHSKRASFLAPVRELGNAYAGGAVSWLPLDFRAIHIAFFANLAYWFVLIFWFVLWSDRRWRQKRAARIDA